jgi:hypothetical protein
MTGSEPEMSPSLGPGQVMFKPEAAADFEPSRTLQVTVNDRKYVVYVKDSSVNENESRGQATASELGYGGPFSK